MKADWRSVVIGVFLLVNITRISAGAQPTSAVPWYQQVETFCGSGTIAKFYRDQRTVDGADTAGDNATVIATTRRDIVDANNCLFDLRTDAPSAVSVWLRDEILGSLAFMINAYGKEHDIQAGTQAMQNETRVAIDQCQDPSILLPGEPYDHARIVIGFALDRATRIYAYRNTPLDDYKSDWRSCAMKLGKPITF